MPGPEMDLKQELFEAGNRLLKPPGSVDELLALLDRVEHCLSFVEQQPPVGMQDALCPAFKALITNELIQHPDADVRVGVTACLTEISRITAPDIPYNDALMKEVFRLTISAFEGLSDNSSKSFGKRVSILETVARVRSCAVLLDLECNGLIVDMFKNFYKCIRDFHAANVLASMESIMSLVIDEIEDISNDLLFALISVLKKENKDASPMARKLGENVVQNCAARLKSCIVEAVKSLKINLVDYDFVVTLACQVTPDHHNLLGAPLANGSESAAKAAEEVDQVLAYAVCQEVVAEVPPSLTISAPSNGNAEAAEDVAPMLLNASDKLDSYVVMHPAETIQDNVEAGRDSPRPDTASKPELMPIANWEPKSDKIAKRRGRKPKSVDIMQSDSSKLPRRNGNKSPSDLPVLKANMLTAASKASPEEESSAEPHVLEKKSDSSSQILSPRAIENNAAAAESPSLSDSRGKSSPKRIRRTKKPQEATSSHQPTEKRASVGPDDTEMRLISSEKDTPDGAAARDASKSITLVKVKKEQDINGDFGDNLLRQSDAQLGITDGTPRTKKRGRPRKDASMSAATGAKDGASSEGGSRKRFRRRFSPPEDGKEYGEELVGSRIKVWWPQDKVYYDGIVESFDPIRRKHKILYTDNEKEVLNLHREKWKLVTSGEGSEKGGVTGHSNAGEASDTREGKRLRTGSSSIGAMENTDSPLKKRRGRPPKNTVTLPNYDSAVKVSKPEGEARADESKIDPVDDAGNPIKPMDSVAEHSALPNLNAAIETSEDDVTENGDSQAKQDLIVGMAVMDTVAPKAVIGLDINETFILGSDEQPDVDETPTPKSGNSDVNLTEGSKSGHAGGLKSDGAHQKSSASGTEMKRRKRKVRTSSSSMRPAVPGGTNASVKRRRGRPARLLLGASDGKSKDLGQPLGEPKVVVKSEDFLAEVRSVPYMRSPLKVPDVGLDVNVITKSTPDSVRITTNKEGVAPAQNSSKSITGGVKIGSQTRLKLKFKTSGSEEKPRRSRLRKNNTALPPEQLNKDGSVKKPRGRPCKPKVVAPKSEGGGNLSLAVQLKAAAESEAQIIHKAEASFAKGSGDVVFENDGADMVDVPINHMPADAGMSDKQMADKHDTLWSKISNTSVAVAPGDLTLGLATETIDVDVSQKSPESATRSSSSKEMPTEADTAHEREGKSMRKLSKNPTGGPPWFIPSPSRS